MKHTIAVRLEQETIDILNAKAEKAQRTVSDYLRLLIEEKL